MQSTYPATHVIACPHCCARWRLPTGPADDGSRRADCPRCGEAFLAATPDPYRSPLSTGDEDALDRELTAHDERRSSSPSFEARRGLLAGRRINPRASAARHRVRELTPAADTPYSATARIIFILALAAAGFGLLWVGARLVGPERSMVASSLSTIQETQH